VILLVPVPWAGRVLWTLPFLSTLVHSERHTAEWSKRHKKLTDWAGSCFLLVRRWHPRREIVALAEGTYASLQLLDRCRGCPTRSASLCACASRRRFTNRRRHANLGRWRRPSKKRGGTSGWRRSDSGSS
jgi:hypothetical protein